MGLKLFHVSAGEDSAVTEVVFNFSCEFNVRAENIAMALKSATDAVADLRLTVYQIYEVDEAEDGGGVSSS